MTASGHKVSDVKSITPARTAALAGALLGLALLTGCGAGSVPAREADVHEGFARIQRHEAEIDDAGRRRQRGDCAARCGAMREGQKAAAELCSVARRLEDADALRRCAAARERSGGGPPPDCNCGR